MVYDRPYNIIIILCYVHTVAENRITERDHREGAEWGGRIYDMIGLYIIYIYDILGLSYHIDLYNMIYIIGLHVGQFIYRPI